MNYLELLLLAAPEAIIVVVALAVLTIGLTTSRPGNFPLLIAALGILLAMWTAVASQNMPTSLAACW